MKRILLVAVFVVLMILIVVILTIHRPKVASISQAGGRETTSASALLSQAKDAESKGKLIEAKASYQKLINDFSSAKDVMSWQKKIEELNIRLLFSPILTVKSVLYEVKPGDTLVKIAKEFRTTVELIMKSNNLTSDMIIPGKKLKVLPSPFSILVDKSQNTLMLKSDEDIIKTYTIATGANNSSPVGTFKIVNKLANPTWFKAGAVVAPGSPENILGTRWLGFDLAGFGIHGTTDPQSLGLQVTQGCVRMSNAEVEELYTIVPVGTEVTIVE